jgi:arylsulfatase A-like enzyme
MNSRDCIKTSLAGAALAAVACLPHWAAGEPPATQPAGAAPPRPNIVVIFDPKHPRRIYAACMSAVDDAVGVIVAKLRAEKLDHNTLILFASDNGGISERQNHPLRGAKQTPYEGGFRTPLIACWPDRLPAGKVYDGTVSMADVLPTAVVAATGKPPAAADGVDLVPYLTGERQGSPHETLVWSGGTVITSGADFWAVRHGRWKLIGTGEEPTELYDLVEDLAEKNNRMSQHPEITQDLVARRKAWRQATQ